jgi:UDP-N-acetylglucosamine 4,6-dehydratase/5-epimerase
MNQFENKILLITGGTGSFGNAALNRFLNLNLKEIRIFSRDEKKQDDMRKKYSNNKIKFFIGDVRDADSISPAIKDCDYVFHAAALKQVPSCEFFPLEAVKTNVLGTENVLNASIANNIKKVICLSTDKAVYPVNAMGISKAMMEKIVVAKSRISSNTVICLTRYGNVMGSRGSVIPLFINQLKEESALTVTDPNMTRFMMSLDDALDLVLYAFDKGASGDIFVQKAPASTIKILIEALSELFNAKDAKVEIIGTRHGEKLFETLLSREEMASAQDLGGYFRVKPDSRDLNYNKFIEDGEFSITEAKDYNSHNTTQLTVESLKALLMQLDFVKESLQNH